MDAQENRETRQEIIRTLYQFRSAMYEQQRRAKHCRTMSSRCGSNAEMAEAYSDEAARRSSLADFLHGEIRDMARTLAALYKAA